MSPRERIAEIVRDVLYDATGGHGTFEDEDNDPYEYADRILALFGEPVYDGVGFAHEVYDQDEPYVTIYKNRDHPHAEEDEYTRLVPVRIYAIGGEE